MNKLSSIKGPIIPNIIILPYLNNRTTSEDMHCDVDFTEEKREIQKDEMTCPRSQS